MKRTLIALSSLLLVPAFVSAAAWPASSSATDLGSALIAADTTFEPSGIVWSSDRSQFIAVGDEGQVAVLGSDGTLVSEWSLGSGYDLEDVTVVPGNSTTVYLMDENTSSVFAFDLSAGALTGDLWSFSSVLSEVSGTTGVEGLAWVPDGYHAHGTTASGGLFYAGWQYDGDVYVFEPDFSTGAATFIEELHLTSGYTDLSGLYFSTDTQMLYVMYDALNVVQEWTADGIFVIEYTSLPGADQEGVTIIPTSSTTADFVLAEDSDSIRSYANYPIAVIAEAAAEAVVMVVDADTDGVAAESDCNDADATVSSVVTYYVDADLDTLGSTTMVDVCAATAPSGYATNTSDTNDAIPNYGIEIYGDAADNDGDGKIDEINTLATNGIHPYYGSLIASDTSAYGSTILWATGRPGGYFHVKYADNSVYRYRAFSSTSKKNLTRTLLLNTAYVSFTDGTTLAVVNAYTGAVLGTRAYTSDSTVKTSWMESLTGLDLP